MLDTRPPDVNGATDGPLDRTLRWAGIALHVVIGIFPLSATGLLAPPWALVTVAIVWVLALVGAWRLGRARPRLTPLVPVATLAAWFGLMTIGDLWLGWVA